MSPHFRSLAAEIAYNRKWGGRNIRTGSKFVRGAKFGAKMIPQVRLGLALWEIYNVGAYVYDRYMDAQFSPQMEQPQSTSFYLRNSSSLDELMEEYYFG